MNNLFNSNPLLNKLYGSIIGHNTAIDKLAKSFGQGKAPHAWLITGPKGIGKFSLIENFMKILFSECNNSANRIEQRCLPDLLFIEKNENEKILVDDIRKIIEFLSLTPAESKYRVVIIDNAEKMNINASNALLKQLEEPAHNTYLFLITHSPSALLPTIKSRCRELNLKGLNSEEATKLFNNEDASRYLLLANNSPGQAIYFSKNNALFYYQSIIDNLLDEDIDILSNLGRDMSTNKELWGIITYLIKYLCHQIIKGCAANHRCTEIVEKEEELIYKIANSANITYLLNLIESIDKLIFETEAFNLDKKQVLTIILEKIRGSL